MKLGNEVHEVEALGIDTMSAFIIEAHSISFKILSDQLYSDKILAVVRELCCNAFDAHVDGGKKDVPFRVHMPNTLEPWFAVRDWGIGLSHDNVIHLYTTYFGSTKRGSNDKVGCLGLGSKSPFAYTDSFTVTSWHDGVKRIYTAFIGEEGIPMITQMGTDQPTDEINGLEVSLSVEPKDFSEFADKAETALRRFNPAPESVGSENFNLESVELWMEGKGWAIRKEDQSYSYHRSRSVCAVAVQGSVAYPIDPDALKDLTSDQKKVLELPIDIYFDLGELGITPSRESLSYSDGTKGTIDTIGNVIKRLDKVFAELPKKFENEFDSCASHWDACVLFNEMFNDRSSSSYALSGLANSSQFNLTWKGKELESHFNFEGTDVSGTFRVIKFERRRYGGRAQTLSADYNGEWKFRATKASKFFFDDVGRGAHTRIKNYVEVEAATEVKKVYLIKYEDVADFKKFVGFMGNVEVTAVSTLPKPVRQATANNGGSRSPQCKVWLWDTDGNAKENWDPNDAKLKDGGVYVTLRRFRVVSKHGAEMDLSYNYRLYKELGLIDSSVPIFGLQPRNVKSIADNPKWVSLEDYAKGKLETLLSDPTLAKRLGNAKCVSDFELLGQFCNNKSRMDTVDGTWSDLADTSVFKNFVTIYNYMLKQDDESNISAVARAADHLGCDLPEGKPEYDLDTFWNTVLATYPMFEFLTMANTDRYGYTSSSWSEDMIEKLVQYIKGIDKAV